MDLQEQLAKVIASIVEKQLAERFANPRTPVQFRPSPPEPSQGFNWPEMALEYNCTSDRLGRMVTVASVLKRYEREHLATIATGEERARQLRRILASHLGKPMAAVGQRELMAALDGWRGATRNRYRACLTHFWKWARQRGLATLRPELDGHREASRDVTLSLDQLRTLWATAPARGDWRGFCRLLIVTGARRGEVAGMTPRDVQGAVWLQPSSKNGTAHVVPLGPLALAELREGIAWTGKKTFADMKERWSHDADLDPATWRLHDIRRSFATLLVEDGADAAVVDRHLNHVAAATARGIARVYNRAQLLDRRKALALRWEAMLFPKPDRVSGNLPLTLPGQPSASLLDLLNDM